MTLFLLLLSCDHDPVSSGPTTNPNITVEVLFVKDGCTMHRFEDGGRSRYYVTCKDGNLATLTTESCGKSCTTEVEVQTVTK